jgi:hypothetical protein
MVYHGEKKSSGVIYLRYKVDGDKTEGFGSVVRLQLWCPHECGLGFPITTFW